MTVWENSFSPVCVIVGRISHEAFRECAFVLQVVDSYMYGVEHLLFFFSYLKLVKQVHSFLCH